MRGVVQRVASASVEVDGQIIGQIDRGLLIFIGIENDDTTADGDYIIGKAAGLRVFDDEKGVPNLSVTDIGGSILLISQFTLCADVRHGRRPSYIRAARPETAVPLYEYVIAGLKAVVPVETGQFGAEMQVRLVNDGPHTILLDSRRTF